MNELEKQISNILKEIDKNIKLDNKQEIEKNRKILDELLETYLEKFK